MVNKDDLFKQTQRNIENLQTYRQQLHDGVDEDIVANFDYYAADFNAALQVLDGCDDDTVFIDITAQFDRERMRAWTEQRPMTATCDLLVGDCLPMVVVDDTEFFTVGSSGTRSHHWFVVTENERKYRIFNDPKEAMLFKLAMEA